MSSLKVGLIGAGVFGGYHAGKIAGSRRTVFAGVYDRHSSRAEPLAEQHSTTYWPSEEELLESCEAVIVACPASQHEDVTSRALSAGRHVLVEKPLALTGEAARALAAEADRKGLVLQVGHQERLVLAAMGFSAIPETPVSIEAVREGPPSPTGRASDVSVIFDLMIHDLDMTAQFMGAASRVLAGGRRQHTDQIDEAEAEIEFENGGSALLKASRAAPEPRRKMVVTYPSGSIAVDFLKRHVENSTPFAIKGDISPELPDPLGAADEAFFAACLKQRSTLIPGRETVEAVRLAELIETRALQAIGA